MSAREKNTLLIVDDDRLAREMLADVFESDFEIIKAEDGEKALEILKDRSVAAVLCDHTMPKMTGVEVLRTCMEMRPEAVRILVTASEDAKNVRDAINLARVARVLGKPLRPMEVEAVVKGAIREQRLEQENKRLVAELKEAVAQLHEREMELERELNVRTRELKDVMERLMAKK